MKSDKNGMFRYGAAVSDDERYRQLINADWEAIASELKPRTQSELYRWRFRGEYGGAVPGGREVEDFIQKAITECLAEMYPWDVEQQSLIEFLWSLILLYIKRYGSRVEAKYDLRATTNPQEATAHVADVSNARQSCYQEPEDFVSEQEAVAYILERFRDDPDYRFIEVILCEEVLTPREIAEKLGIEVKEVHNAKKRLKRDEFLLSLVRKKAGKNRPVRKKASKKGSVGNKARKNHPAGKTARKNEPDRTL